MRLPSLPGPRDVAALVEQAWAVLPRVTGLLGEADALLADARVLLGDARSLIGRMEETRQQADAVVASVAGTRAKADAIIEGVDDVRRRADGVIEGVEQVRDKADTAIGGVDEVRLRANEVIDGVAQVRDKADTAIGGVDEVRLRANGVIDGVADPIARMRKLLDLLEPSLLTLQPVLDRLAESTDPDEVEAAVKMIDRLPKLEAALKNEVMPLLTTLETVAPDMHNLLVVVEELSETVLHLPGMGRIRRKVEEQQDEDTDRAS